MGAIISKCSHGGNRRKQVVFITDSCHSLKVSTNSFCLKIMVSKEMKSISTKKMILRGVNTIT